MTKRSKIVAAAVVLFVGGGIAASAGGNHSSTSSAPPTQSGATQSTVAQSTPTQTAPASKPKHKAKPEMTVSQQQAVESAQSYLSLGSGFSRQGLIDQLSSSAGEGFPKADAIFAVDHLHVNWNQQAVESAKSYMQLGGFSRNGLIQQLESSAGSGFTHAQAEFAANAVGL